MHPSLTPFTAVALFSFLFLSSAVAQEAKEVALPKPNHADVSYGPHARNVFDLWLPTTGPKPSPLVIHIHGGGFARGDKSSITAATIKEYRDAGWAVASLNYRLTDTAPLPTAYLDCARALQHLRHHAANWQLDPKRVALTGISAGAGTSLWIAFHDDLADPKSADPIARQSTRVACVVGRNAQPSYDPRFAEKVGIPRPNFERGNGFLKYGITKDEIDTPKAYQRYESTAPITYLSREDPPVLLRYGFRNEKVSADSDLALVVHHPLLGIALKREMDKLGIECVVQYRGEQEGDTIQEPPTSGKKPVDAVDFIRKHFEGRVERSGGASR